MSCASEPQLRDAGDFWGVNVDLTLQLKDRLPEGDGRVGPLPVRPPSPSAAR